MYMVGENVSLSIYYGKQYGVSSKKIKTDLPYDPDIPLLSIYSKEEKTGF